MHIDKLLASLPKETVADILAAQVNGLCDAGAVNIHQEAQSRYTFDFWCGRNLESGAVLMTWDNVNSKIKASNIQGKGLRLKR